MADIIEFGKRNPLDAAGEPDSSGSTRSGPSDGPRPPSLPELETLTHGRIQFDPTSGGEGFQQILSALAQNLKLRFLGNLPRTLGGQVQALEDLVGLGNVAVTEEGKMFIRRDALLAKQPGSQPNVFVSFNREGFDLGDLVGIAGTAVGAAANTTVREVISQALTEAEPQLTPGESASDIISDGMENRIARRFGNRRRALVPLEIGQVVVDTMMEEKRRGGGQVADALARADDSLTPDSFFRGKEGANLFVFHRDRRRKAERRLTTAFGELTENPGDPKRLEAIAGDLNTVVGSIVALQRFDASRDFGQADRAAGGGALIRPVKLLAAIQRQIDRFDAPGIGADAMARVEALTKLRDELIDENGAKFLTAQQVNEKLQRFGSARYGGKPIIEGFAPPQSRGMAGTFEDALVQDVETTRLGLMGKGEASDRAALALFEANSSYQFRQREIRETFNSALSRLTGNRFGSTEALALKFLQGDITAPELRTATTLLLGAAPGEARKITCLYIESALELGKSVPDERGVRFKADDFAGNLPDAETLATLGVSKQDIAGLRQTALDFQRIAEQTIADPKGPASALGFDPINGAFTLPDATAPQEETGGGFVIGLPPQMVADAMLTGEGRQSFGVLADPDATPEAIDQATVNLFTQFDPPPEGIRMPSIFIPSPDQPQTLDQILFGP